jgi:hypothetical protein
MASTQNEIPRVVYHPLGSDLRRVFIALEAAISKGLGESYEAIGKVPKRASGLMLIRCSAD